MSKPCIFTLDDGPYTYRHPVFDGITFENAWCRISDGEITVSEGYSWDGCSPKKDIFGLVVVGTPDGRLHKGKPITYYASLVHDVLCQFKNDIPVTKDQTLELFGFMLREVRFAMTPLYVTFVDWLGPQEFLGDRIHGSVNGGDHG